jgi:glycosyltransferase involved in cell wall biosynthesis
LSAGKPIIAVMSDKADIAKLINSTGCGWVVNNAEGLYEIIREISLNPELIKDCGKKAKESYKKYFKKETILARYREIFTKEFYN